ncbi:unnamed protein product [Cladocopium goreaui]|uniref:Histidine kinase n=1 Tax=Cladocopium goreaui TaxID=2562237 RepID=A0A9P1BLC6_9DINO|nr:unnamed protein product [Cladocopium goreaui]
MDAGIPVATHVAAGHSTATSLGPHVFPYQNEHVPGVQNAKRVTGSLLFGFALQGRKRRTLRPARLARKATENSALRSFLLGEPPAKAVDDAEPPKPAKPSSEVKAAPKTAAEPPKPAKPSSEVKAAPKTAAEPPKPAKPSSEVKAAPKTAAEPPKPAKPSSEVKAAPKTAAEPPKPAKPSSEVKAAPKTAAEPPKPAKPSSEVKAAPKTAAEPPKPAKPSSEVKAAPKTAAEPPKPAKPSSEVKAAPKTAVAKEHVKSALLDESDKEAPRWSMLLETFAEVDVDGNGCISKEELLAAVKDHGVDEKEIQEALSEIDKDQDGQINYAEFMKLMKS